MTGLVRKPVLPSPVRQVRSLKRTQAAVLMIHPTELAVRRPDVRRILRCLLRLTVQTVPTAASTPVIILVIQTVRQAPQHQTPEVAAAQPVTDVTPKPVIILINPAAHRAVPIPQVLVPAALTRFPTVAAELADVVNLVVIATLRTGVPFTRHVMATAVLTELSNLVTHVAAAQDVLPAGAEVIAVVDQAALQVPEEEEYGLNRQIIFGATVQNHLSVRQINPIRLFRLFMNGVTAAEAFMNMTAEWLAVIKAVPVMQLWLNAVPTLLPPVLQNQTDI